MALYNINQNISTINIERFNITEYDIGIKVGKYNYGSIAFCKKIKTKKIYTIKIYKKCIILQNKLAEHVYNEYTNLRQKLNGINTNNYKNLYFLFEYILGEPLKLYIKKSKKLSLEAARFYLASLITCIDYLHKKNIIYRDLRPENIIINDKGYIKLSDFTYSKKLKTDLTYTLVGTPEYYSPEMINQTGHNKSVDFWQLGILLYEMLVGNTPFIDTNPMKLYQKIKKGKIIFPKNFNKYAKIIIKHFLNSDMNKRLGCTKKGILEIIEEPFFKYFDWEKLLHRTLKAPFIPKINRDSYKFDSTFFEENNKYEENDISILREKDIFYNW